MPALIPFLMIATYLAIMVVIKMVVAPAIILNFGWLGVVVTILALLAFGRWLELTDR